MSINAPARGQQKSLPWLFSALLVALILAACATVPITGRTQLMLYSDMQMSALGDRVYADFLKRAREWEAILTRPDSPEDARRAETVRRIGEQIVAAAGLQNRASWDFTLVRRREANAFALPNGKVVVFTGLLRVTQTDAGLAAVIGHEIGHVMARHSAEMMSQKVMIDLALGAADAALAARNNRYRPLIGAALGLGALYGISLPYSRLQELEADRIGLVLMAKAGFDPAEGMAFWERMEARGGSGPWEYLSTHPSDATRRAELRQWLPEANALYAERSRSLPQAIAEIAAPRPPRQLPDVAPVAFRPAVPVGYTYRVQPTSQTRTFGYRVESLGRCRAGECYVIKGDDGRSSIYTRNFSLFEIREADGSLAVRYSPPLQFYQWPLRVGDRWSHLYRVEAMTGKLEGSATLEGQITGYETITTQVGSFITYKVLISLNDKPFREFWFAPEIGLPVRTTVYDLEGKRVTAEVVELDRNAALRISEAEEPVPTTSTQASFPAGPGSARKRWKDQAEMVYVPAGTFTMGDNRNPDQKPAHEVTLSAFWIDRFEVTHSQFNRFVQSVGYSPEGGWRMPSGRDRYPATGVTWHDASAYCYWAEERLPTEAEWEYAARGTDGRRYPWGNKLEAGRAHSWGAASRQDPVQVGSNPGDVSPFDVRDMAGNVAEWVSSAYKPYPYVRDDGREDDRYPGLRVVRGGSATSSTLSLAATARVGKAATHYDAEVGFRCVQDP